MKTEGANSVCFWVSVLPLDHKNTWILLDLLAFKSQYQFQCSSCIQRCQNFDDLSSLKQFKTYHLYSIHWQPYKSKGLYLYTHHTHTHKQYSLGLLIVYFLCNLLQGRAKNEFAWHIRIQTYFVLWDHRYRRGHGSINITSKTTYYSRWTHSSLSQN